MKLYNIYQQLILESSGANQAINDAIDNKYMVNIMYSDSPDAPPTKRYIQIYVYGVSKDGNDVIRAYQLGGTSKTGARKGWWRLFRLDRIQSVTPTNMKWYKPVHMHGGSAKEYMPNDKEMISIYNKVSFDEKYLK
jgi:predicted DNA-binding transcriptional regulator YafY